MLRHRSCPDRSVLERLLLGGLDEREQRVIEGHLEGCETCRRALDALACGDDAWPRRVRDLARDHTPDAPGLRRVIGVLKDEAEPGDETVSHAPITSEEVRGLLDPPDEPGDLGKLGPYRVVRVLGQGGMGIVFRAFDPALHRAVAIKILAPQLGTVGSARQRFAREARAAAAIRNEHVVAIHAVDEWKGLPYLVMEFIPGVSLQERIDRSAPLDVNSILRIGAQAASGLAAAHAQGLVHRDVKPSNILLENGVERVKLTDFGLARAVDDASLTRSGIVAGTPLFMAPEQARCEIIDHRADLFSLGAVLYAMAAGRSPFRAPTTMGVLRRVCDDPHRPIRAINPDVPRDLAAVIDRLLAKDPARRFATASEVAATLNRQLAARQRGADQEPEPRSAFWRRAFASAEDVGPAKRPGRRRRLIQILASLLVILAGLLVTEVTGVTRIIGTLTRLPESRAEVSRLIIYNTDPEVRVAVDGGTPLGGARRFDYPPFRFPASGCLVETYRGEQRLESMFFNLKPGLTIELVVDKDGRIRVLHEDPIYPPRPWPQPVEERPIRAPRPWPPTAEQRIGPKAPAPDVATPLTTLAPPPWLTRLPLRAEVEGAGGFLAYLHQGHYLVAFQEDATITVHDATSGETWGHRIQPLHFKSLATIEDRLIAAGEAERGIHVWDMKSLANDRRIFLPEADFHHFQGAVVALACRSDGSLLASAVANRVVELWDPRSGRRLGDVGPQGGHAVTSLRFAPDDATLAVGRLGGGVELWRVDVVPAPGGQDLQVSGRRLEGAPSKVRALAFSGDGRFLAVAGENAVGVWDRHRGLSSELPGLDAPARGKITALAYAPGSTDLLAVGFGDGSVSIWKDARERARFHAQQASIVDLAFHPDGEILATSSAAADGVRIWELVPLIIPASTPPKPRSRPFDPRPLGPDGRPIGSRPGGAANRAVRDAQRQVDFARMEKNTVDAEVKRAEARIQGAEAHALYAREVYERMKQLAGQGAVGAVQVDEHQAKLDVADADARAARFELWIAQYRQLLADIAIDAAQAEVEQAQAAAEGPGAAGRAEKARASLARLAEDRAWVERELAAKEVERAKALLSGAQSEQAYRGKAAARLRQLADRAAVERRVLDDAEAKAQEAAAKVRSAEADVSRAEALFRAAEVRLKGRIEDAIGHDPAAAALRDEIHAAREELSRISSVARSETDPARVATERHLERLQEEHDRLVTTKREEIGRRVEQRRVRPE